MKSKQLKALLIDQDAEQAKQFSIVIKDLFSQLYVESNLQNVMEEFKGIRPQVLFMNLNINQRNTNLECLEKLDSTSEEPVIIFGYNDAHEPELLGHAIESGVHDVFLRPFDSDLISTKINRYFISEKTQNRDLQYSKLIPPIPGKVKFNFKMISVDENGLTFQTEHYICKGTVFPIQNKLIKEIFEVESQEFMVTKTWISDDSKNYFLFAEPKDAKEQTSAALRRFILRKI